MKIYLSNKLPERNEFKHAKKENYPQLQKTNLSFKAEIIKPKKGILNFIKSLFNRPSQADKLERLNEIHRDTNKTIKETLDLFEESNKSVKKILDSLGNMIEEDEKSTLQMYRDGLMR